MFNSENSPLPIVDPSASKDTFNFKIHRQGSQSNNIVMTVNVLTGDFGFLPAVIPQGVNATSYVVNPRFNIVENINTTDFRINKLGVYKYSLTIDVFSDVSGIFSVDIVNGNNVEYRFDTLAVKNITNGSVTVILEFVLGHNIGNISRLRFGGVSGVGGPITINISKLDLFIESV